jgi:hypothetical protein
LSPYVAINTIKATSKCNKKGFIKFPQFLGRTSTMNKNKKEKINIDEVNLLGEKPKVTKATTSKPKEVKEPKVKAESKAKRETKPKVKK